MTERKTVKDVLAAFHKKSDFRIGPMSGVIDPVATLSTGNFAIDHITGVAGIPRGRSVELFGPPSSGKTTTALQTAVAAQQQGLAVLYLDYEQSMDKGYAQRLGLDTDSELFLFTQPDSIEDGMTVTRQLIATGELGVVIFDSVAAMTPNVLLESDTGETRVGLRARLMAESLNALNPLLREFKTTAIFLNHVRDVIEMGGRPLPGVKKQTTPGGSALKFYASLRFDYHPVKSVRGTVRDLLTNEDREVVLAQDVRVTCVKNKVAPPYRKCEVRVRFGRGFSNEWSALQVLLSYGQIVRGSAGYFFFDRLPELVTPDMPTGSTGRPYLRGESGILEFADRHPDWAAQLVATACRLIDTGPDEGGGLAGFPGGGDDVLEVEADA